MLALAWLIPVTLALGGAGLVAYLWSVSTGQYEDLDAAAWRILENGTAPNPSDAVAADSPRLDPKGAAQPEGRHRPL